MRANDLGCFEPLEATDSDVGVKADRLRRLMRLGIPVPSAFVLPHGAEADGAALRRDVGALLAGPFSGVALVVRSSASDEDAAISRAPGVYDSFLDRRTIDEVLESIALCRSAIASAEASSYRAMMGLSSEATMHVILQRMVETDVAGVLNTRSPLGDRGSMLVEWTTGLGTPVVSGDGSTTLAVLPRQGEVDAAIPAAAELRKVGVTLERHFGRPQEIEWGISRGRLYVFQTRDAAILDAGAFEGPEFEGRPCQPLAPGYAIAGHRTLFGSVGIFERAPRASELHASDALAAIIVRRGGPSSHSASMCRERAMPTVRSGADISPDATYVIDAVHGTIAPLEALPVPIRKRAIFAAARTAARRGKAGWVAQDKYEAVLFDPVDQERLLLELLDGRAPTVVHQRIVPFDDPERTYTGMSARMQISDGVVRLQFKRANVLPDRPMRFDQEVHLQVHDERAAVEALGAMGYVPFPEQERVIERWDVEGVTVLQNTWPGARHPYIGIEAPDAGSIVALVESAGMDASVLAALDGKELFALLEIRLDAARFEEVRGVA